MRRQNHGLLNIHLTPLPLDLISDLRLQSLIRKVRSAGGGQFRPSTLVFHRVPVLYPLAGYNMMQPLSGTTRLVPDSRVLNTENESDWASLCNV